MKTNPVLTYRLAPYTLLLAALLVSSFPIPLFLQLQYVTGSFFGFLALALYGPRWGITTAAAASIPTFFIWGHPYAILLFTTEAVFAAWILTSTRRTLSIPTAVVLYWITIGLPLSWFSYHLGLELSAETSLLMVLKMAINAITNGAAAALLLPALQNRLSYSNDPHLSNKSFYYISKINTTAVSLPALLSHLVLVLLLISSLVHLTVFGNQQLKQTDDQNAQLLHQTLSEANILAAELDAEPYWRELALSYCGQLAYVLIGALLAAILFYPLFRRLTRPISELTKHTSTLLTTDNRDKLPDPPHTQVKEFGFLAQAIRSMADELNRQLHSLESDRSRLAKEAVFTMDELQHEREQIKQARQELQELTEQLRREKAQMEIQRGIKLSVLESTREGMLLCNRSGVILYANQRMSDFFGAAAQEAGAVQELLERLTNLIHLKEPTTTLSEELLDFLLLQPSSPSTSSFERKLTGEAGQLLFSFSLYAVPVQRAYDQEAEEEAAEASHLLVFRDRTEEEEQELAKENLISQISHEFRTPLTSILGFSEIMRSKSLTPERSQHYTETIHKEALRLSRLVDDFLDLQRMEAGKQPYYFVPLDLVKLTQELLEHWRLEAPAPIRLEAPESPVMVRGDADRIRQVLHNLIGNAVKYSGAKQAITLRLRSSEDLISLDVMDQGLGIPEEDQNKIFRKFYRVDHQDRRKVPGSGLGLTIVKEIVEAHGGQISLTSVHGSGSTFTVWLPPYKLPECRGKLLLLEKEPAYADKLEQALKPYGISCLHLESYEEALLAIRCSPPEAQPLGVAADLVSKGLLHALDFLLELARLDPLPKRLPVYYLRSMERGAMELSNPLSYSQILPPEMWAKQIAEDLVLPFSAPGLSCILPSQDPTLLIARLQKLGLDPVIQAKQPPFCTLKLLNPTLGT